MDSEEIRKHNKAMAAAMTPRQREEMVAQLLTEKYWQGVDSGPDVVGAFNIAVTMLDLLQHDGLSIREVRRGMLLAAEAFGLKADQQVHYHTIQIREDNSHETN